MNVKRNNKGKQRKKAITIKVPLSQIEKTTVYERVKKHLEENADHAYTISGLLVEVYDYKPEELNASFRDWPKGAPSQYTRVRLALEKLVKEEQVNKKKQGRMYLYWWSGDW